jgi:NTP pyrophosphatase (non-canonical NTP hydrolase)
MSTFEQIESKAIQWARDRKIIENSTPLAQTRKTLEEVGELLEAAAAVNALDCGDMRALAYRDDYIDAVGDIIVTLIVGTACAGVTVTECLEAAFEQIKDRRGHLRADGVFVKEAG